MNSTKVKKALLAGLSLALVAVMAVAGTVAYLQDDSEDVINTFSTNNVNVDLTETTGNDYNIIPGTSQDKNPTVTVNASLPAYVYVEVTDDTQGLVTYEIAEGWTKLEGYDNVYYREFDPAEEGDTAAYGVLKDNKVSYSASLTNEDMKDEDGNLKTGIELTFKAYAIQKNAFDGAGAAWLEIPTEVSTGEELLEALEGDKPILLTDDIDLTDERGDDCYPDNPANENGSWTFDWIEIHINKDCNLDLGGHTLTSRCRLHVGNGATVTISNGTLVSQPCQHIWEHSEIIFALQVGNANLTLNDVNLEMVPRETEETLVSTIMQISSHDDVKDTYGDTTVTINGGTLKGNVSLLGNKGSDGNYYYTTVNFNGGTIINTLEKSSAFDQSSCSTLNINGGTVDCAYVNDFSNNWSKDTCFNISGGTFTVSQYVFKNTKYYTSNGTSINLTGGSFNEQELAQYIENSKPYTGTTYIWGETEDGYTVVRDNS